MKWVCNKYFIWMTILIIKLLKSKYIRVYILFLRIIMEINISSECFSYIYKLKIIGVIATKSNNFQSNLQIPLTANKNTNIFIMRSISTTINTARAWLIDLFCGQNSLLLNVWCRTIYFSLIDYFNSIPIPTNSCKMINGLEKIEY